MAGIFYFFPSRHSSNEKAVNRYTFSVKKSPALFLDRDGTLIEEVPYLSSPSKTRVLSGVPEALAILQKAGFLLFVVSNQSGIARGLLDEGRLLQIQAEIDRQLGKAGACIDAYYHCPHHPAVGIPPQRRRCNCRKPQPGLLDQAASDFNVDWTRSAGIGDDLRDLQAFAARDIPAILVGTGKGRRTRQKLAESKMEPALFVGHLPESVPWLRRLLSKES